MKNKLFPNFYNNLTCRLYVLGNSFEGESIIFLLCADNQVIYSCITDSFIYQTQKAVDILLNTLNIENVTDIFWTHPHDDHSEGLIDLVKNYKPKHVFIPSELQKLPKSVAEISRNILSELNQYHSYDKRFKYQPVVQGIGTNNLLLDENLKVNEKKIPFSIFTISPCAGKTRRKAINEDFNALNDYSIAISIVVGDFSILLTGDIQDRMIQYVTEELSRDIPVPNILKIPHHGSRYSTDITSFFENDSKFDIAITTAKQTSKLPTQEALDYYCNFCERIYKIDDNSTELAIWGIEVDIIKSTIHQIIKENFILV